MKHVTVSMGMAIGFHLWPADGTLSVDGLFRSLSPEGSAVVSGVARQ